MQSPACRYLAPPEPDLIPKQPPSQPSPAGSHEGGSSAAPGRLPGTPRSPSPCHGPFSQPVLHAPGIGRHGAGSAMPTRASPSSAWLRGLSQYCPWEPDPTAPSGEAALAPPTFPAPALFITASGTPDNSHPCLPPLPRFAIPRAMCLPEHWRVSSPSAAAAGPLCRAGLQRSGLRQTPRLLRCRFRGN